MTEPEILTVDRWCGGLDETAIRAAFREDEARDRRGRWTGGGGGRDGGGLDAKLDYDAIHGAARSWGDREDAAGAAIWKAAGYDSAQTRLVSQDEFDRLTGDGHIACYRGVHGVDQATADSYADAWKTGTQFCGEGMHGAGTYTSTDPAVGDDYAWTGSGAVLKIGLAPDANVVSQKDIERQYETDKAAAAASGAPWSAAKAAVLEDPGHYASYKGYDAISVSRADGSTWYLIQNRGATVTVR